jgi:hypothetical protein
MPRVAVHPISVKIWVTCSSNSFQSRGEVTNIVGTFFLYPVASAYGHKSQAYDLDAERELFCRSRLDGGRLVRDALPPGRNTLNAVVYCWTRDLLWLRLPLLAGENELALLRDGCYSRRLLVV